MAPIARGQSLQKQATSSRGCGSTTIGGLAAELAVFIGAPEANP
jgi:hypothetical protein